MSKTRDSKVAVSYEPFICCNSFICENYDCKVVTDCVYLSAAHAIIDHFCKGSAIPLKHCMSRFLFLFIRLVTKLQQYCRRFTTHVISYANAIHIQILGKFVLLLPCSKGAKISVIYQCIGDWNKQKIGIGKFKNMHIGATLIGSTFSLPCIEIASVID